MFARTDALRQRPVSRTRMLRLTRAPSPQIEGVDFRFQQKMRGVVEYMQYREMPSDIKRKVRRAAPAGPIEGPVRPSRSNLYTQLLAGPSDSPRVSVSTLARLHGGGQRPCCAAGLRSVARADNIIAPATAKVAAQPCSPSATECR